MNPWKCCEKKPRSRESIKKKLAQHNSIRMRFVNGKIEMIDPDKCAKLIKQQREQREQAKRPIIGKLVLASACNQHSNLYPLINGCSSSDNETPPILKSPGALSVLSKSLPNGAGKYSTTTQMDLTSDGEVIGTNQPNQFLTVL